MIWKVQFTYLLPFECCLRDFFLRNRSQTLCRRVKFTPLLHYMYMYECVRWCHLPLMCLFSDAHTEKTELFLELFGNTLVRTQTADYLRDKATDLIKYVKCSLACTCTILYWVHVISVQVQVGTCVYMYIHVATLVNSKHNDIHVYTNKQTKTEKHIDVALLTL